MTSIAPAESISDYGRFDFAALWKGREKVTEVEREIVARCLRTADRRRVLEVGTGFGRLLGRIVGLSEQVVATDFDAGSLARLRIPDSDGETLKVAANVYHLPFVDGAFTCASMVRVYHHLTFPARALAEVARVLGSGGRFLLSYNPKPSVGTLVNDIQRALHPSDRAPFRSITFARGTIELPPDPFPVYVAGREQFQRIVRSVGLRPVEEVVSGLEEYYLMRFVPAELFVRLGVALGRAPIFPNRFVVLAKVGSPPPDLPDPQRILACPRCQTALGDVATVRPVSCKGCGFQGVVRDDVLDLRYVPPGSKRWEAAG